ncbi:P74 (PIF-0) [Urbanus proteus nucleopolyhedrovirus]|uniref:P74 (PIF-0) n=1 Tax=Urbanus proteus nucleopolyhedrovirus TaxID=1675866 RepID=A0A162GUE5_9ABAC|nr:P74 (PIF-0) [Urbanus proteus nucleopolyhedrovirus]AKR17336.1 P74 (PIF-0) [Urbanus proteus nucleopolyhedrovirus]
MSNAPTLTIIDLNNSVRYATHQHRLRFITKWRRRFPHILINYKVRAANNDDYYVPPKLADRCIYVTLTFSKRGCESMSCYPFDETKPITFDTKFGYTQTSDTSVPYAQPACYNLDRSAATREDAENEIQSPELRYTVNEQCILVDTLSKMYFNSPYLRTENHTINGVDDVPGFNVAYNHDMLLPEKVLGTFNDAYCRRFGRSLTNGGCSMQWWESLIGFVLGDTIYITFKLLANNVFNELKDFDYTKPSPLLPPKPVVDSNIVLRQWQSVRDSKVDVEFESKFDTYKTMKELNVDSKTSLKYVAETGFVREFTNERQLNFRRADVALTHAQYLDDQSLEDIITKFLEDNALLMSIVTDLGFEFVLSQLKRMLKVINTKLIPVLKKMLLSTSRQVTVRLLGETYKAAVVHMANRAAIKLVSTLAKAMTRIVIKASSVVGIVLILLTLTDLILALWDPFGYNNMFPRQFPEDLSNSFLRAYFAGFDDTRHLIEFIPEFFDEYVETDDANTMDIMIFLLEYIASLDVNSNGQLLDINDGEKIEDFDEATLVGNALASSALYTKLEFLEYTERHNKLLFQQNDTNDSFNTILSFLCGVVVLFLFMLPDKNVSVLILLLVFLLLLLYYVLCNSLIYFLNLHKHAMNSTKLETFKNLYT